MSSALKCLLDKCFQYFPADIIIKNYNKDELRGSNFKHDNLIQ